MEGPLMEGTYNPEQSGSGHNNIENKRKGLFKSLAEKISERNIA